MGQFQQILKNAIIFISDYSKQVKQRVSERFLFIHNLEEEITYTFSVRAQTIDYGPPVQGNVTTGILFSVNPIHSVRGPLWPG